jgi:c-di-GMP-binding flagellar brake protein YcgR
VRFEVIECAMIYEEGRSEPYRAVVVDIGLGGLQVRSKEQLPVGAICRICIGRDGKQPLDLPGEVRYSHAVEQTDLMASGVRFLPKNHEQRIAVAEFVHSVFENQGESLVG